MTMNAHVERSALVDLYNIYSYNIPYILVYRYFSKHNRSRHTLEITIAYYLRTM